MTYTKAEILALAEEIERCDPPSFGGAGWTDHTGEGRPHSPTIYVQVRFRDGDFGAGDSAIFSWVWSGAGDDIVAWRQIEPPTSIVRAGQLVHQNVGLIVSVLRELAR